MLETTARFLNLEFHPTPLIGTKCDLSYVRGYFDADGGMPRDSSARLYLQLCQKSRPSLEEIVSILEYWNIECGRVHNPSVRVDPDYWRFFVRTRSQADFVRLVSSWHPMKRQQMENRMKI